MLLLLLCLSPAPLQLPMPRIQSPKCSERFVQDTLCSQHLWLAVSFWTAAAGGSPANRRLDLAGGRAGLSAGPSPAAEHRLPRRAGTGAVSPANRQRRRHLQPGHRIKSRVDWRVCTSTSADISVWFLFWKEQCDISVIERTARRTA